MGRKLKAVLADIIEARISVSEASKKTCEPNLLTLLAFATFEGIKEKTGSNDGTNIDAFNYTTGTVPRSSYCQNAWQSAIRYVENTQGKLSNVYCTGNSQEAFNKSPVANRISLADVQAGKVKAGDALIYRHGTTTSGHTAVVVQAWKDLGIVLTAEANTSSGPGVVSNGDGVYFRIRKLNTIGQEMHLIGAVRPYPGT